jgi:hypothetical protein
MRYAISEAALNEMGKIFVQRMKNEIKKKQYPYAPGYAGGRPTTGTGNKYASGNLYNSLAYKVVMFQDLPALQLMYADYFELVNRGIKPNPKYAEGKGGGGGNSPFIQSLLKWISIRGIKPKGYAGKGAYKKASKLGLALAIRKNIFKYGIAPAGFYDKTYDKLEMLFENPPPYIAAQYNRLGDAIGNDIENLIDNIIKQ